MKKCCTKCGEVKLLAEFCRNKTAADGYTFWCRGCKQAYYQENKEALSERSRDYYQENKAVVKARSKTYQASNKDKVSDYNRTWRQNNPEQVRANTAKRKALKLHRTPEWADLKAIEAVYKECPDGYHVDHEVPLQGDNVSGLHVENNLRHIPAKENLSKGKYYESRIEYYGIV